MFLIGCGSLSFYCIGYEFLISLTYRKGQSLTTGCINFLTCAIAIALYELASWDDSKIQYLDSDIMIYSQYLLLGLAFIMLYFVDPNPEYSDNGRESMLDSQLTQTDISNSNNSPSQRSKSSRS